VFGRNQTHSCGLPVEQEARVGSFGFSVMSGDVLRSTELGIYLSPSRILFFSFGLLETLMIQTVNWDLKLVFISVFLTEFQMLMLSSNHFMIVG
jgi:hypothetical protein